MFHFHIIIKAPRDNSWESPYRNIHPHPHTTTHNHTQSFIILFSFSTFCVPENSLFSVFFFPAIFLATSFRLFLPPQFLPLIHFFVIGIEIKSTVSFNSIPFQVLPYSQQSLWLSSIWHASLATRWTE